MTSLLKIVCSAAALTLTFAPIDISGDTVANSYTEYGCNNYAGFYSDGQCVTNNAGDSTYYECDGDDMIVTDYSGDECDVNLTFSFISIIGNCADDQSACDYGVWTWYDSGDDTCNRTVQGTWDTFTFSYFTGICLNQTYTDDNTTYVSSSYYECSQNGLIDYEYATDDCTGNYSVTRTSSYDRSLFSSYDWSFYCSSVGVEGGCNANFSSETAFDDYTTTEEDNGGSDGGTTTEDNDNESGGSEGGTTTMAIGTTNDDSNTSGGSDDGSESNFYCITNLVVTFGIILVMNVFIG